jgi:ATP-dependent RNA helicase DHX29
LRQQLLSYLIDSSFVTTSTDQKQAISQARYSRGVRTKFVTIPTELNVNAENAQVLGAALAAGLYPKLINLDSAGGLKTIINQQPVAIVSLSSRFLCGLCSRQASIQARSTSEPRRASLELAT